LRTINIINHSQHKHLIQLHHSSRVTTSDNPSSQTIVYYEEITENHAKLIIGKYCSIAPKVSFYLGGNHNISRISTWLPLLDWEYDSSRDLLTKGDIIIGNDVWVGRDVTILSGVKIGNGSVIGTGSVVAKDVEPYSIMVGNPAKCIKKRFNDEQIELLEKTKWWDLDIDVIKENSKIIFGESFDDFIEMMKKLNKI
jgi:chloramphenicol O-acetyltransferase type B